MEIPVFDAKMPDSPYWTGIVNISLVDEPAMESLFVKFNKEKEEKFSVVFDEEKHIVVGALIIPDKLIFRRNEDKEFFVKFSKEVISEMREKMMKDGSFQNFSLHHSGYDLEGWKITPLEMWIKEFDEDKSNAYGFNLPVGTLFMSAKINDVDIWERVKQNEFNGFSIESIMDYNYEKMEQKFLFSKIAVGMPVMVQEGAVISMFSGKFNHESQEVSCDENGIITEITPLEPAKDNTEDKTNSNPEKPATISDVKAIVEGVIQQFAAIMESSTTATERRLSEMTLAFRQAEPNKEGERQEVALSRAEILEQFKIQY